MCCACHVLPSSARAGVRTAATPVAVHVQCECTHAACLPLATAECSHRVLMQSAQQHPHVVHSPTLVRRNSLARAWHHAGRTVPQDARHSSTLCAQLQKHESMHSCRSVKAHTSGEYGCASACTTPWPTTARRSPPSTRYLFKSRTSMACMSSSAAHTC
jgi:hypothetical protein